MASLWAGPWTTKGKAEGIQLSEDLTSTRVSGLAASDLVITDYRENSIEPEEVWNIAQISREYRHMGFFTVKLLPVLVVKGIRLDLGSASGQTNWLGGFRCDWSPRANPTVFEWRDFSVFFPGETAPRLRAKRVYPVAGPGSLAGRLEGVILQTGAELVYLPRAEVRATGRAGEIVWQDRSAAIRWDLFSTQCTTNTITQGKPHEKP